MEEVHDQQEFQQIVNSNAECTEPSSGMKFSFKFAKQTKSNVVNVEKGDVDMGANEEITHLENGLFNGQAKPKKKVPIIARIQKPNDWRVERLQAAVTEGKATDEQKALLALLLEGFQQPLVSTSSNDDLELKPQDKAVEAEDIEPDYEQISSDDFGAAFLRGRGWKKGEGIGRTNKRVVPLVVHAKGKTFDLGLTKKKKKDKEDSDEPVIPLEVGVSVQILYTELKGKYGRVKSIDPSGQCNVELPDKSIHEIQGKLLQTISDKDYSKKTKIINKNEVDKYEKKNDETNGLSKRVERRLSINENHETRKDDDEIQILETTSSRSISNLWAAPDLLVRLIDKKYKDGRYYKEKMIVVGAHSENDIDLKDDRKRLHTVKQSYIETVIPRGLDGRVMILKGRQRGRVGTIVRRDDRKYELQVRVMGNHDVIRVDFDDACEYRGNMEDIDYD